MLLWSHILWWRKYLQWDNFTLRTIMLCCKTISIFHIFLLSYSILPLMAQTCGVFHFACGNTSLYVITIDNIKYVEFYLVLQSRFNFLLHQNTQLVSYIFKLFHSWWCCQPICNTHEFFQFLLQWHPNLSSQLSSRHVPHIAREKNFH